MAVVRLVTPRRSLADPRVLMRVLEGWRYRGARRDLRLDLLRGFAAFAMVVDHVGGNESWLYPITGGDRFFVSAAEAFVLISGIVLGIVYRGVVERRGVADALMKALHRAWMLYVVTVLLSLSFAWLGHVLRLPWAPTLDSGGPLEFALNVATLHRTVYLVDVLLMYTLLLLIAVPAVLLLSQGRTMSVLAASWAVWAVWQFAPGSASLAWTIEGNDVFHISPWQVVFVTGIALGWHRDAIRSWLRGIPAPAATALLGALTLVVLGLYVAQLTRLEAMRENELLQALAFDKPDLAVGRLIVLAALSVVSYALVTWLWVPVRTATAWLLLPLGQHALTAYSLHIYLVAALAWLARYLPEGATDRALVATVLQLIGVGAVWLAVLSEDRVRGGLMRLLSNSRPARMLAFVSLREERGERRA